MFSLKKLRRDMTLVFKYIKSGTKKMVRNYFPLVPQELSPEIMGTNYNHLDFI